MRPPGYLTTFDSAPVMLRALARYLHGRSFPALGMAPALQPIVPVVNRLSKERIQQLESLASMFVAVSPRRLDRVDMQEIGRWAVRQYPRRRYPAVAIGASNGAAVHLCAALGIPWLPQTFLVTPRLRADPDDVAGPIARMAPYADTVLARNPDTVLYHMRDPNHDRTTVGRITYFRLKRLTLGRAYEEFLRDHLSPGSTIFVFDCQSPWPVARLGPRHLFQFGGADSLHADEMYRGSDRVARFLAACGSSRRRWEPPAPTEIAPEAEWGFEPRLMQDVERFARDQGHRVVRLRFPRPDDLSPFVAELYRAWNQQRGVSTESLLVECFMLLEPTLAVQAGLIPYWMTFTGEASAHVLGQYLNARGPFQDLYVMLFSNGIESMDQVPIEDWRALLRRHARRRGRFLGVQEDRFPRDFASLVRYHIELKEMVESRALPVPMSLGALEEFAAQGRSTTEVAWDVSS